MEIPIVLGDPVRQSTSNQPTQVAARVLSEMFCPEKNLNAWNMRLYLRIFIVFRPRNVRQST